LAAATLVRKLAEGEFNVKWEELRMEVKNCEFAGCPRNRKKLPILFDRSEDSLARGRV